MHYTEGALVGIWDLTFVTSSEFVFRFLGFLNWHIFLRGQGGCSFADFLTLVILANVAPSCLAFFHLG